MELLFLFIICNVIVPFTYSASNSTRTRCLVEESLALLNFKANFIMSKNCYDPFAYKSKFASWNIHSDCCSWNGVDCDPQTDHVIGLDLSSSCLFGSIDSSSTLFRLFWLSWLNLAYNDFNSSRIPEQIGHLKMLTRLDLSYSGFSGQIPPQISNLSNLVSLDLSNTNLKLNQLGFPNLVQHLSKLEQLHLSSVDISSEVPQLLVNFSSLESLELSQCGLRGEFPVGIFQLPNIKNLDINGNPDLRGYLPPFSSGNPLVSLELSETNFAGEIPFSIGNLDKLEQLDISSSKFTGQIPSSLGNLTNLSALGLSDNSFSGHGDSLSWLSKLTNLNKIDFHGMNLNGNFLSYIANLTKLSYLDLGYSNLTGPIPKSLMNLTQLSGVFLDHNELSGEISPGLIYGDYIEFVFLGSNQLSGQIPSVNSTNSPIMHLDFSSNKFQGNIPGSICKLKELMFLELHSNNLAGEVDMNMFFQLSNLAVLSLSFNELQLITTDITSSNAKAPSFSFLGLGSCNITQIPSFLQNQDELQFLDLSSNNIHGKIPSWVWNISHNSLEFLNLSYNALTGFEQSSYPVALQWSHLQVLDLRSNLLQGSLSVPASSLGYVCRLRMINLSQNQIQGELPRSFSDCKELELLDLRDNIFADVFPYWLGVLPRLRVLILRSNNFIGVIGGDELSMPYSKQFSKLQIIDLSHNHFTGTLPAFYFENWSAMKAANENPVRYMGRSHEFTPSAYYTNYDYSITMSNKGLEMEYLKIPSALAVIDFSNNRFEGDIPDSVGNLKGLRLLNLSRNVLTGQIPSFIANLKELECLDLSVNRINGEIPQQLVQMTFLSSFNVAYNQLGGPIPRGNQFDTYEANSYQGNLELCGVPLKKKCGIVEEFTPPAPTSSGFAFEFGWKVVVLGYGIGFITGAVIGHVCTRNMNGWFGTKFGR